MTKQIKSTAFTMALVLVSVAVFSALVLGSVYQLTLEPIKQAKSNRELEAIREVVYGDFTNNPYEERHQISVSRGKGKVDLFPARDENGKILLWNDPRTAKARSKTFQGIADAMAEQWGDLK